MINKLSRNSEDVLKKRYYLSDKENWPALCNRVVDNVIPQSMDMYDYTDEEKQQFKNEMFTLINELKFLPNSPTLFNAGTPNPMLSACFIIDVEDSMEDIFESIKKSALVHKFGGGVGLSIHKLRVKGSKISTTHGSSSGSCSFLVSFSDATRPVAAIRRKGANMCNQSIFHGDIEEFINLKTEEGKLDNFNISVTVPDSFMTAVKDNREVYLTDPKDNSKIKSINAKELLYKIATNAHKNGEPGIAFIDTINRDNPCPHLGRIFGSNPCQPGWATVLTPTGIRTFDDIDVGSIIWSGKQWTKVINKVNTGKKDVLAYKTRAGVFYGTENHRVVQDGEKVEVKDAVSIDLSLGAYAGGTTDFNPLEIMNGLVFGDGTYHGASNKVFLLVGRNDESYFEDKDIMTLFKKHRPGVKDTAWEVETSFKYLPKTYDREVPSDVRFSDSKTIRSFLRGLYSANGSVVDNRITLKTASEKVAEVIQEMLSSIGIYSYITVNKEHSVEFRNGTYICKQSYDLNIGDLIGRSRFKAAIGFIQPYKTSKLNLTTERLSCRPSKTTYDIIEKEYIGEEEVYDITVDAPEHTYWTGGLLVSNCGEFYNIPYSSCNLGSINLSSFVKKDKSLDWDDLKKTIKACVLFLDCIIDVNKYPLALIDETTKKTRPVGLGIMGFADALIKMGIKYDSEEGLEVAERISEFFSYHSLMESSILAEKRGSYPEFKPENHKYERYSSYGKLDWKKLVDRISKKGLRNSHTYLIAPTGTLARIANETSFGIEPVFAFSYESNILDGKKQTFNHQLYQDFLDKKLDVNKEVFVGATEISWQNHIKVQAAWQKFVHNGISKTINMPKSATVEDVLGAYIMAYEYGLKGITVYREGSRDKEVLVASGSQDKQEKKPGRRGKDIDPKLLTKLVTEKKMSAAELSDLFDCSITTIRKRVKELGIISQLAPEKIKCPDELEATRYKIETPAGVLYVEVGKDAETRYPIETILNISKSGSSVNAVAEALGKMVSKALQHRMDPYEVIDTLKNILGGDNISWWRGKPIKSIPDALAKVLEVYMKEHVDNKKDEPTTTPEESSGDTCPICGELRIIQEGCSSCGCGSKCG